MSIESRKIDIQSSKSLILLPFLFGLLITFQVFKFNIGGFKIYPSDLFFYSILLIYTLKTNFFKIRIYNHHSRDFLILLVVNLLFSLNFFIPFFEGDTGLYLFASFKYSLKFILYYYLFLIILLQPQEEQESFYLNFFKGIYIGAIVHALFGLLEIFFWYQKGILIKEKIFNPLGINEDSVGHTLSSFVTYPVYRISGLHFDPNYTAIFIVIGLIYSILFIKKSFLKKIIILLFITTLLLTFSRSSFLAISFGIFFLIYKNQIKFSRKAKLSFVLVALLGIISFSFWFTAESHHESSVAYALKNRIIFSKSSEYKTGELRHLYYPILSFEAISSTPQNFLLGFGNRNGGRAFKEANITEFGIDNENLKHKGSTWDIETDAWRILLNRGIVGFIFFYLMLLYPFFFIKKIDRKFMIFLSAVIVSYFAGGLFYGYSDNLWFWIFIFSTFTFLNGNRILLN